MIHRSIRQPRRSRRGLLGAAAAVAAANCVVESLEQRTLFAVDLVKDINPTDTAVAQPSSLVNANGTLYFLAAGQLYKSNGTAAGTSQVTTAVNYPTDLTAVGST